MDAWRRLPLRLTWQCTPQCMLAIQAYLHRSPSDVAAISSRGGGIRLVKGAYNEPPEIAYQDKNKIRVRRWS